MALIQLTENVFAQDSLVDPAAVRTVAWNTVSRGSSADLTQITHIVNWYKAGPDIASIQAATAASIKRASSAADKPAIRLIGCVFEDDIESVPSGFHAAASLRRTVLDVARFRVARKLPLLFDILQGSSDMALPSGYLVFTNADICLVPQFYSAVRALLSWGFDSLIINRRTVGPLPAYGDTPELAELEAGYRHGGFDCFVFPANWLSEFHRSDACIGAGWVMRSLLYNLVARSNQMLIFRDPHLTYHYGNDEIWSNSQFDDYTAFNLEQARSVLTALSRSTLARHRLLAFCATHAEPLRPEM